MGIGDLRLGPIPNLQSSIPNILKNFNFLNILNNLKIINFNDIINFKLNIIKNS
jgi:hypothetical protein